MVNPFYNTALTDENKRRLVLYRIQNNRFDKRVSGSADRHNALSALQNHLRARVGNKNHLDLGMKNCSF